MITVMLLAHNEIENVKMSIESIRLFSDIDISLIVVDNNSTDGLNKWAKEQRDLTYVLFDEGNVGWGKAINMVRHELQIDTDLLIMEGNYILTPGALSRMVQLAYEEENIGAVGGMYNGMGHNQLMPSDILDYKMAIEMATVAEGHAEGKRALMLHHGVILWKRSALDAIGEFEENVDGMLPVMNDYSLRMIVSEKKLMICLNAFFWNLDMENVKANNIAKSWELEVLEKKWGIHYFNGSYNELLIQPIEADRDDQISVLEIGCSCGGTLVEIKNRYPNAEVFGTEISEKTAEVAGHVVKVVVNNIEEKNIPFPKKKFDYIIFGDVLEHLHNPLETLIYCKDFLCEGGSIIASIPNVMHISIMEQLMKGNFTYTETGLLDKTHIHLFTCNEIIRMFNEAGYEVCDIVGSFVPISDKQKRLIDKLLACDSEAQRFMYETFQYNVKAKVSVN